MTIEEKDLLADSMDMFGHGNEDLNRAPAQTAPEPEKEETAPVQTDAELVRDQQGRFAPKEAAAPSPAPAPQAPVTPAANADADPEKQPVSKAEFKGMLDERDKRQKAEARLAELEKQLQQRQPTQIPTDLNPEQINQHIQSARSEAVFTFSERVARKQHGDDVVQSAMDWGLQRAQQNPAFRDEYLNQADPIDWAVKQHKRERILNEIGDDPDAFEARIAARLSLAAAPPQTEAPRIAAPPQPASLQPQTPAPPRSIANAPSAGGGSVVPPTGEFAAIEGMFNR